MPSYCLRLLALPCQSRTATQKPTHVYAIIAFGYISPEISCRMHNIHIPQASTVAQSLTLTRNFARISSSQESARITLLIIKKCTSRRSNPQTGASELRSAIAKLIQLFGDCKKEMKFFTKKSAGMEVRGHENSDKCERRRARVKGWGDYWREEDGIKGKGRH